MDKTGKKISHYLIEKKIGEGQFGVVYLATSEENKQKYAIKCLIKNVDFPLILGDRQAGKPKEAAED